MKLTSNNLQKNINVNKSKLADLLGVTEKELSDWEEIDAGYPTIKKSKRLILLSEIVEYISKNYQIEQVALLDLLNDEKITFNPNDLEDGSCSLIGFINANSHNLYWKLMIAQIMEERLKLL